MNKDQVKGRMTEITGKFKVLAGKLSGDKTLEEQGLADQDRGTVQSGWGDLKNDLKKNADNDF